MALTDESNGNGFYMPVAPAYGGGYGNQGGFGGFGGDGWWVLLILLAMSGGWGFGGGGFGGGYGNMMLGYDFPWLLNGQNGINNNVSDGFRTSQLQNSVTSVRDGVSSLATQLCGCCGDIQTSLCNGFNGVTGAVTGAQNAISQQMYANQIADLNRSFDAQTAVTQGMNNIAMNQQNCCCENRAGIADLKYTVATENCADRTQSMQNTRDIIDSQTRGTQAILDKLCQLELDGVKAQVDAKNDQIRGLQAQLNMADLRASQTAQNAFIAQGFANEVDQLYNRLNTCPVPTTPVYGRTPIFQCNNNNCGCSCGNNVGGFNGNF